jgi:hypothetical protein
MRVTVTSNNNIGKVTFGKVTKVANLVLDDLLDVIAQNPVEDQILTYQANLNSYIVKTHPITLLVDGGTF